VIDPVAQDQTELLEATPRPGVDDGISRAVPYLEVIPDTIPTELRRQPWVLWRAEPRPGAPKPAKVPYQVSDPTRRAKSTDPATWGTFDDAVDAYGLLAGRHRDPEPALGSIAGIGVVLTADAGITCLDLDRVLDGNTLDPRAAWVVARCQSWTERSPSGTGVHIFGVGTLPEANKGDQFEAYSEDRYIAVTGHRWAGTPATLGDLQPYLDQLVAGARDAQCPRVPWTGARIPPPDDLGGALLARIRAWGVPVGGPLKRWQDGYLIELVRCPWADVHTTGPGGAAVLVRASGALDFTCLHAHCADRTWRDFRLRMERAR
jgi:hypothetical protein